MIEKNEERLFDLLSKKAIYGLSVEEQKELERNFPEWAEDNSFEVAASAINLASVDTSEKMPAHLHSKIMADAENFFESKSQEEMQEVHTFEREPASTVITATPKIPFWQKFGWGVAAFACIALAVNLYVTRVNNTPELAGKTEVTQSPTPDLTDAEKRQQLLASTESVIKAEVAEAKPGEQPEIKGDIVWDSQKQKGYMRFKGLPANDPTKEQYQLWIFDENQDEKYPIDGGVFDVNKDGEVIIPIDAKINVKKPTLFAVTKEKPGGVVVSDRTGIIAVAKV